MAEGVQPEDAAVEPPEPVVPLEPFSLPVLKIITEAQVWSTSRMPASLAPKKVSSGVQDRQSLRSSAARARSPELAELCGARRAPLPHAAAIDRRNC